MAYKRKEITNHREIERIVEIHEIIAAGNYPTTEKLAKRFECSTSTISRDIDFLRDRCEAPLEYDSSKRGYFYTEPNFQLKFDIQKNPVDAKVADEKRSFSECVDYRKFNLSIIPKKLNKKKKKQMKKNLLDSLNDSNSLDLSIINKKH